MPAVAPTPPPAGPAKKIGRMDLRWPARLNDTSFILVYLAIANLALHFAENPAVYNHLETQTDEAVIAELTALKGIGVWTAQMFLMFTLARPDVFAPDDIGLQRAIQKHYNLELPIAKQTYAAIAEKWKPYRTIASFHLWQSLTNTPT